MRARKSERTAKILLALTRKPMTAQEVGHLAGCSTNVAATTLLRLFHYGQVSRQRIQQGTVVVDKEEGVERPNYLYRYAITEKGRKRLEHIAEAD